MKKYRRTKSGKLATQPLITPPKHVGYKYGQPVKIEFDITKCRFLTPYPSQLDRALTAPYPGYVFTPSFKAGHWDGHHHFITRRGYFPTGLLSVVVHILKTGKNPLIDEDKKEHNVLANTVVNVEVIPVKNAEKFYYPGMENYYENQINIMENFEPNSGEFIYPTKMLRFWSTSRGTNELAGKIMGIAKILHEEKKKDHTS